MAFVREVIDRNIWRASAQGGKEASSPIALIASTRADQAAQYSPDGKQIVFVSDRSGRPEIWIANANGTNQIQVTSLNGEPAGRGNLSPDGYWLYFTKSNSDESPLMKMPSAGGPETQVLPAVYYRGFAPAGKGVYFIYREGAKSASIRFLNEATGEVRKVQPLTKPLGLHLSVSPDEQFVLWSQEDHPGSDLMLIENFR